MISRPTCGSRLCAPESDAGNTKLIDEYIDYPDLIVLVGYHCGRAARLHLRLNASFRTSSDEILTRRLQARFRFHRSTFVHSLDQNRSFAAHFYFETLRNQY